VKIASRSETNGILKKLGPTTPAHLEQAGTRPSAPAAFTEFFRWREDTTKVP